MTILYATGFDFYTAVADLENESWNHDFGTASLDETDTCSAFSRQSLNVSTGARVLTPATGRGANDHLYIAFWFMLENSVTVEQAMVELYSNTYTENSIKITTSHELRVINPLASELGISSTDVITPGTWHYIEIKWVHKDSISADDCIVKVDGNEVLNLTATTDTKYYTGDCMSHYGFRCGVQGGDNNFYDDVIIYDANGSTWNDFMGPRYISTLIPDGAGNYSQWTRSGGAANYETVDDAEYNSDTSYIETSTLNNIDTYTFGNLDASVNAVDAVFLNTVAKKSAGDNFRTVAPLIRISSTDYEAAYPITMPDAYINTKKLYMDSPATATAWTPSEINGAEFGIKVKT
jgi:hypothetical protein